jgi:chemotaxis methyl-accepting protein methylase
VDSPLGTDDPAGFAALLDKVERERGLGCRSYKERCLLRRIGTRMRARGAHTFDAYAGILDADAAEYDRLVDALTVNVTKLFRNWEAWASLAEHALPELLARDDAELRAWSAGSSSGDEAYSLAALFRDAAASGAAAGSADRVRVLGTDIDRGSLDAAARAAFPEAAFADTPDALRARHFTGRAPASPVPELRRMVRFERRDLLREPAPPGPWHLIACRNVLIYFDRASQEALLSRFADALVPGGVLFLGKVEMLIGPARARFAPLVQRDRIYRRVADRP